MTDRLPRGIWYEAHKKRYRVRLYRNHVPHLKGYYATREEAELALEELRTALREIPKRRKRGEGSEEPVHEASFSGVIQALREKQKQDPRLLRRQRAK
jgi:hypothetical protein